MSKRSAAVLIALVFLTAMCSAASAAARLSRSALPDLEPSSLASELDPPTAPSAPFASLEPGAPPSVPVGVNPSGIAVNETTHTVYVVNQTDDSVSVLDTGSCNAEHPAGCGHPLATISLGQRGLQNGPVSALVSPDGQTLYVTSPDGANELAVINAAACNATRTSGCATGPVATVATGETPLGLAEDPATDTLYAANLGDNTVSVIDGTLCNARQTAGCGQMATAVPVGSAPLAVAFDRNTRTVYVANLGDDTVSVIDARSCNAQHVARCPGPGHAPPTQAVGGAPAELGVSRKGRTIYVANSGNGLSGLVPAGGTVSVIDAAACNGAHPQGCSSVPAPAVGVGGGQDNQPQGLAVDQDTGTVYVADSSDDTLSVIDGRRCHAGHLLGCAHPAPAVAVGAGPNAVAVDPQVHTVYVSDSADNGVAVIDDRTCTADHVLGCRPSPAPVAPLAPSHELTEAVVDPAQHTAYVIDSGVNGAGPYALDLIDTTACRAGRTSGCDRHPPLATVTLPSSPSDVALDPRTDTLYVAEGDPGPNELEVIAAASCNATVTSCARTAAIPFPAADVPQTFVVDSSTHTVYLGFPTDIGVIDARHCNAQDMSDCATQTPARIPVPFGELAVAPDTLYSTGSQNPDAPGWVSVIATRHCQAADTSQCANLADPPRVPVGLFPQGVAVDLAHHTLYVADNAFGDSPGQVSMVATTRCNGDDTSGCADQVPPTVSMPRAPLGESFDPLNSTLYVTNFANASVSPIDTATCNALTPALCPPVPRRIVTGSGPWTPALNPTANTIYVPNFYDGTVSIVTAGS